MVARLQVTRQRSHWIEMTRYVRTKKTQFHRLHSRCSSCRLNPRWIPKAYPLAPEDTVVERLSRQRDQHEKSTQTGKKNECRHVPSSEALEQAVRWLEMCLY
jgi:hypothetical protein